MMHKAAQPHWKHPGADTTAVFTACGRPDLLLRTLVSFFETLDEQLYDVIVVEDSGSQCNAELEARFPDVTWITHPTNVGQIRSIDIAYARVTTPYVFHCEDDWEFVQGGFLAASRRILQNHPSIFTAVLRGTRAPYFKGETLADGTVLTREWTSPNYATSFTFNPGLRRMSDYAVLVRYGALVTFRPECAGESEWDLAVWHHARGFRLAHAHSSLVFVKHIGGARHVHGGTGRSSQSSQTKCPPQPAKGQTFVDLREKMAAATAAAAAARRKRKNNVPAAAPAPATATTRSASASRGPQPRHENPRSSVVHGFFVACVAVLAALLLFAVVVPRSNQLRPRARVS